MFCPLVGGGPKHRLHILGGVLPVIGTVEMGARQLKNQLCLSCAERVLSAVKAGSVFLGGESVQVL